LSARGAARRKGTRGPASPAGRSSPRAPADDRRIGEHVPVAASTAAMSAALIRHPGGELRRTSPGAAHPGRCRRTSTPALGCRRNSGRTQPLRCPRRCRPGRGALRRAPGLRCLHGLVLPVWRGMGS